MEEMNQINNCYNEYVLGELYNKDEIEYLILGSPESQRNDYQLNYEDV